MKIKTVFAAAAILFAGLFTSAEATPITYKLGVFFSGTVGSTSIGKGTFLWTVTSDTTAFVPFFSGKIAPALTSSIDIPGFGTLTPTGHTAVAVSSSGGTMAFLAGTLTSGIGFGGPVMMGYDGTTSFGTATVGILGLNGPIQTDRGAFDITDAWLALFQARTVPEPLTIALFGAGIAGFGALRRRRTNA